MRQLLARRDARIYLTGQLFSLFGDSCLWLAMGIWVRTLTGSNAQAGLVHLFLHGSASLLAPALGLLADRVRRRPLLLAANTAHRRRPCSPCWPSTAPGTGLAD